MSGHHRNHLIGTHDFNKIIQILTYSDSVLWGGYVMMNTLVAIYLEHTIAVDPLPVISLSFSIYMIARSLFQIPIAKFFDLHKSFIDETIAISISCVIIAISIFSYRFITQPWHLYCIQAVFGLGVAINLPAWRKTFSKFIDTGHEGVEYSIYDIVSNIAVAVFTAIGGYLIETTHSFLILFNIASIIALTGGIIPLALLLDKRIQRSYD
jgi:MFS family permease